jgi:hypothetical protein
MVTNSGRTHTEAITLVADRVNRTTSNSGEGEFADESAGGLDAGAAGEMMFAARTAALDCAAEGLIAAGILTKRHGEQFPVVPQSFFCTTRDCFPHEVWFGVPVEAAFPGL